MAKAGAKKRGDAGEDPDSGGRGSGGYWSGAHTVHRLRFHLTFIPKSAGNCVSAYRKRVLEGVIAKRVEELFGEACEVMGWELHELSVQPDHVHLAKSVSRADPDNPPRQRVGRGETAQGWE